MIYHFKSLVLVRKGRAFYATLYQEVFFGNPGGGGSLIKDVLSLNNSTCVSNYLCIQIDQSDFGLREYRLCTAWSGCCHRGTRTTIASYTIYTV